MTGERNYDFHRPPWECDHPVSPEQRLWMAVIQLIFADAQDIIKRSNDFLYFDIKASKREGKLSRSNRLDRLNSRLNSLKADILSDQFVYVCDLANLDSDYVRGHLQHILKYQIIIK